MKDVDLGEPTSSLDHVYLGCTQRECHISKDTVDNYRSMFESWISARLQKNNQEQKPRRNLMPKRYLHGPMTWKVMRRNAWKDIANLRIKQLRNYTKSQRHAWMITNSEMKKMDQLENCPQFAHKLFWNVYIWNVLVGLIFHAWSVNKLARAVTKWTRAHSSHTWIQTIYFGGKHSTTMQIRIVSRLWFCRRPWRFQVNIGRNLVHFGKLISEQKRNHWCKHNLIQRFYVDVDKLIVQQGLSDHQRQTLLLLRLCTLCG